MTDVVIVEAGRSPIGKRDGGLAAAHPADILGPVMMETLKRAGISSSDVGQVVGGCINKVGAQAMNITRTAWLSHGGAEEVAATRSELDWHHPPFEVPEEIRAAWDARDRGNALEAEWRKRFDAYRASYPELAAEFHKMKLKRDPDCALCGTAPTITDLSAHAA